MKLNHEQTKALTELLNASTNAAVAYELVDPTNFANSMRRLIGVVDEANVAFGTHPNLYKHQEKWQANYDAAG